MRFEKMSKFPDDSLKLTNSFIFITEWLQRSSEHMSWYEIFV